MPEIGCPRPQFRMSEDDVKRVVEDRAPGVVRETIKRAFDDSA